MESKRDTIYGTSLQGQKFSVIKSQFLFQVVKLKLIVKATFGRIQNVLDTGIAVFLEGFYRENRFPINTLVNLNTFKFN